MTILINCSNVRFGGGITVAFNIIKYFKEKFDKERIILIVPTGCNYEQFKNGRVEMIIVPPKYNNKLYKPLLNYFLLPNYVRKFNTDFIISLGNIAVPSAKPQILLVMFPYIAYPESEVWKRLSLIERFKKKSIVRTIKTNAKYAKVLFVQTETMKKRLTAQLPSFKGAIKVIPCAVSFTSKKSLNLNTSLSTESGTIRLLFLSKYYIHKNLEILIPLAEEIRKRQLGITITITIDPTENQGSANFLETVKEKNLQSIIRNIGNVKMENVASVYTEHNGIILPTLLESFSGVYIEAFYFEKPVFTSDLDFAHDACKDAAFYFDPLNADNILKVITEAFRQPDVIEEKIALGKQYLDSYKSWDEIGEVFVKEMELTGLTNPVKLEV